MIPISDEQAKLGQELLKTLRGVGSFIEKALGSTPEDLVAYFGGDRLRVRRAENLVRHFVEARRRLDDWGIKEPIPASLSVAFPILQGAADEDREVLVDLWARLLANAMNPNLNNVRHSFIEAVKKMDLPDAAIILCIHQEDVRKIFLGAIRPPPEKGAYGGQRLGHVNIAEAIGYTADDVEMSIGHLEELRFLTAFDVPLTDAPDEDKLQTVWNVTATLRQFLRACYPEITPT